MPKSGRGKSEDVAEYALSLPKLCLLEQLSWQMTLLHMDKRGLQASLHVSSPHWLRVRELWGEIQGEPEHFTC